MTLKERIEQLEGWHVDDPLSPFAGEEVISRDAVLKALPRCETCAHWHYWERDKGNCEIRSDLVRYDVLLTQKDFGCVEWKQGQPT